MVLTCGRTKLRDVDEHLHGYLLVRLRDEPLAYVFAGQSQDYSVVDLAVHDGRKRAAAVLMLTRRRL